MIVSIVIVMVISIFVRALAQSTDVPTTWPTEAPSSRTPTESPSISLSPTKSPISPSPKPSSKGPTRKPTFKPTRLTYYASDDAKAMNISFSAVFGTGGFLLWIYLVYYKEKQNYIWATQRKYLKALATGKVSVTNGLVPVESGRISPESSYVKSFTL